jgi:hypothetical protein
MQCRMSHTEGRVGWWFEEPVPEIFEIAVQIADHKRSTDKPEQEGEVRITIRRSAFPGLVRKASEDKASCGLEDAQSVRYQGSKETHPSQEEQTSIIAFGVKRGG